MTARVEVGVKPAVTDAQGEKIRNRIERELGLEIHSVKVIEAFTIDAQLKQGELETICSQLLADPVIHEYSINRPLAGKFDWMVEVGFLPGVKDNAGDVAKQAVSELLKKPAGNVYTSKVYLINGLLERGQVEGIAKRILANDLIQRWLIADYREWKRKPLTLEAPRVVIKHSPQMQEIDIELEPARLLEMGKKRSLALNLAEMLAIKSYFSDPAVGEARKQAGLSARPTDVELEAIAQTWSEHCKHKIFNSEVVYEADGKTEIIDGLFESYIKAATKKIAEGKDWVVSVFWDNSGVIKFNEELLFCLKCETHNSPSNLEPYGGALTGIVGVYRDPMGTGKGGEILYGTYGFFAGEPDYSGPLKPRIHPRQLLEGVRQGVQDGGNNSGVPTVWGNVFFDSGYMGKCVIYVAAAGLIPAKVKGEDGWVKKVKAGDIIMMAGGRVGIDGIHGATASSEGYHEGIPASHVQIGDPFTQKKVQDFIVEARGFFNCITDCGAGGLSSAVGETARLSGGCEIWLDRVPLKYAGLDPWQILVSESQERMVFAVDPAYRKKMAELAKKHDVELTVIGKYTDSGYFHALYNYPHINVREIDKDKTVALLDMRFLYEGVPKQKIHARWEQKKHPEPELPDKPNCEDILLKMLSRPNICSREYIVRQFDHEVKGKTVIKPLVGIEMDTPSDAVVMRLSFGSFEGIAVASGACPKYSQIDAYHMAATSIDEAVRRVIAVGARPDYIALNDNFCWPDPTKDTHMAAQLVRANKAVYDYTTAFGTPCISGKDSMSVEGDVSDGKRIHRVKALPTLLISSAGKVEDVRKCITMDLKAAGETIYILGNTKDELGGSEYYEMLGFVGNRAPRVDAGECKKLYEGLAKAISKGLVSAAHGCYRGGFGIAIAQMAFGGMMGCEVDAGRVPTIGALRDDEVLFSESAGRFVVSVPKKNEEAFELIMKDNVFAKVGVAKTEKRLSITGIEGERVVDVPLEKLKKVWKKPMDW